MIIKGKGRGRARQLSAHLLRADENERIRLYEVRGTIATDVAGALIEMEARAGAVNTARPLYHASISPDARTPLSDEQVRIAVDILEEQLGLGSQPRVVVLHRKRGRDHVHAVWSRIDIEKGRVISDAWNYRCHEEAAHEMETRFGHEAVQGSLARRHAAPRSSRSPAAYEYQQESRAGCPVSDLTAELTALWHSSTDAESFVTRLETAGYTLARGDRRVFVVIDRHGEVHSLARRITGASTQEIRARLRAIDLQRLPSVAQARERQAASPRRHRRSPARAFRAAAQEVGRPPSGLRAPMPAAWRTITEAHTTLAQITRPAASMPFVRPARVNATRNADASGQYRGKRAILVASFAAKISAAIRDARREELGAILTALMAERDHALRALSDEHGPRWWHGRRARKRRATTDRVQQTLIEKLRLRANRRRRSGIA